MSRSHDNDLKAYSLEGENVSMTGVNSMKNLDIRAGKTRGENCCIPLPPSPVSPHANPFSSSPPPVQAEAGLIRARYGGIYM